MKQTKRKPKYGKKRKASQLLIPSLVVILLLGVLVLLSVSGGMDFFKGVEETDELTVGIDVAKYQGTIDWEQVAASGVDFAIVRVGYRTMVDGEIVADSNARYNMQEAQKHGIKLGVYFFSTAISQKEAIEEAQWVADYISQYSITYPVVYDCEGYQDSDNRHYTLGKAERTDIALTFLETIESFGYEGMFYASRNEMENDVLWEVSRIETDYKIWVAQYPEKPYPETEQSTYSGVHHMWQYSRDGIVPGISQPTDLNVAYFGYNGIKDPQNEEQPEEAKPDAGALMSFRDVSESVTAKEVVNLRSAPSQDESGEVIHQLQNGEIALRTGISDSGWSKLDYNGTVCYAVSSYLTTDLNYTAPEIPEDTDGIDTQFRSVNESVTAKDAVNLRTIPSVTDGESEIIGQLKNGDTATRIGVSDNGWSKLEYNGEICYAVSSYLTTNVTGTEETSGGDGVIDTVFTDVNERVTPKEAVNLRTMPSVTDPASEIVVQIKNGEIVTRTGINTDVGWSRVDYNGQTLYCVSSYLKNAE